MTFHVPVMVQQVIENLITKNEGIYVDCTVGGGGHASKIMESIYPEGRLIGIDQDVEALEFARERLTAYQDRVLLIKGNFADLETILFNIGIEKVTGVFFDLGISSHQIPYSSNNSMVSPPHFPAGSDGVRNFLIYFPTISFSRFTLSPAFFFSSVVSSPVCGMTDT